MEKKKEETVINGGQTVNYRGIRAMPFIIGNETFEKLGTTGTSSNLLVYFTDIFHMKNITATTLVNVFNGSTNFATLLGAFLSDTYFGRYNTLGFASVASFVGMVVITLTAAIGKLHPLNCSKESSNVCSEASPFQMVFLLSGLGLLVVGAGGIRPCNLAFGADQFNPNSTSGKRGINSFFNWYYFTFTFAMMTSLTVIVYVQTDVSWAWGFAVPAVLMFVSCTVFFVGSPIYVKVKPNGSPLTSVVQVLMAAVKKRGLSSPEQPWKSLFNHLPSSSTNSKLSYTDQFRFFDRAAIVTEKDKLNADGSTGDPWRLCSMQQVEEVKCLVRLLPIWFSGMIYYMATTQQQTFVVFQALQSDRRVGNSNFTIPAASYTIFTMIAVTIWIPIYDRIVVPILRRITGKEDGITLLQKMGVGIAISIATMLISAIVEAKRRNLAINDVSSMSALWLVPQLTLIGLSEAFTAIAQVEFYYKQFPENMRTVGGAFSFVGFALSSYFNGFLLSAIHKATEKASNGNWLPEDLNNGRLDYFYYLVSAMEVLNLGYFIICARWYTYKGSNSSSVQDETAKNQTDKTGV